jgi:tetratricopeptide (TPR) repeat protein
VNLGGPDLASGPVVPPSVPATDSRIREVSRTSPPGIELEGVDRPLGGALASARAHPTVATHLAAALEYRRAGVLDRAYDHLTSAAEINPHDAAVNDAMARIWRDWNLPGVGLSFAHRAVYAAPRSATPRHTLGTLLHAMGRRDEAETAYRQAIDLDPAAWYAWQNLCALALDAGRTQEAIVNCQRADAARRDLPKAAHHERH